MALCTLVTPQTKPRGRQVPGAPCSPHLAATLVAVVLQGSPGQVPPRSSLLQGMGPVLAPLSSVARRGAAGRLSTCHCPRGKGRARPLSRAVPPCEVTPRAVHVPSRRLSITAAIQTPGRRGRRAPLGVTVPAHRSASPPPPSPRAQGCRRYFSSFLASSASDAGLFLGHDGVLQALQRMWKRMRMSRAMMQLKEMATTAPVERAVPIAAAPREEAEPPARDAASARWHWRGTEETAAVLAAGGGTASPQRGPDSAGAASEARERRSDSSSGAAATRGLLCRAPGGEKEPSPPARGDGTEHEAGCAASLRTSPAPRGLRGTEPATSRRDAHLPIPRPQQVPSRLIPAPQLPVAAAAAPPRELPLGAASGPRCPGAEWRPVPVLGAGPPPPPAAPGGGAGRGLRTPRPKPLVAAPPLRAAQPLDERSALAPLLGALCRGRAAVARGAVRCGRRRRVVRELPGLL